jgi:glycosyltransferase involved in cell wall biosynthesis
MPRISVLLPVRDAESFLEESAYSILRQSCRDFELLLLYSPSSDRSRAILEKIAQRDHRAAIMEVSGKNLAACLNEGLRTAQGEFIARMDADDVAYPERFARQIAAFEARPTLGLLGSAIRYMNAGGRPGRTVTQPPAANLEKAFLWGCPFTHSSVMMRRSVLEQCGGYRELFRYAEDYDLWLRLHRRVGMDNLTEILLYYRLHDRNSIRRYALKNRRYAFMAQAAWLARRASGVDPLDGLRELPAPQSLPLSEAELAGVYGRMLAGSAHLLGDDRDDPEGNEWWPWLKKIPGGADRRKTVALSSLRCARFYAERHDWRRALRHGLYALITSPRQFINYGLTILRQWRAGIGNKDAPRHA